MGDLIAPKVILDIVQSVGVAATFTTNTSNIYDPTTGNTTAVTGTASVYVTPPFPATRYEDGSMVEANTMVSYFAASGLTFTPALGQKVTVAGKDWVVTALNTYYVGDSIGLYEAGLRV